MSIQKLDHFQTRHAKHRGRAQCNEYHFDGIVNNQSVTLHFWDTLCIDGWTDEETNAREAQRAEVYPLADIVLVCYSVPAQLLSSMLKRK